MAILDKKTQDKIDNLRFNSNQYFLKEREKYYEMKKEAWNLYPEPKNNWNESYSLAKDIFESYLFEEKKTETIEWLNIMIHSNNELHYFDDDCLFNIAKYKFRVKEYEESLKKFKEVVKEAGMRYFEDEDEIYIDFYLHPENYIK
jgi:hypothetical protein